MPNSAILVCVAELSRTAVLTFMKCPDMNSAHQCPRTPDCQFCMLSYSRQIFFSGSTDTIVSCTDTTVSCLRSKLHLLMAAYFMKQFFIGSCHHAVVMNLYRTSKIVHIIQFSFPFGYKLLCGAERNPSNQEADFTRPAF